MFVIKEKAKNSEFPQKRDKEGLKEKRMRLGGGGAGSVWPTIGKNYVKSHQRTYA